MKDFDSAPLVDWNSVTACCNIHQPIDILHQLKAEDIDDASDPDDGIAEVDGDDSPPAAPKAKPKPAAKKVARAKKAKPAANNLPCDE